MSQILKNGFKATGLYSWNASAIDFSKCIRSNVKEILRKDVSIHHPKEGNVLTAKKFTEIVGEERIRIFKEMRKQNPPSDSTNNEANSTQILFALWRELGEPDVDEILNQPNSAQVPGQSNFVEILDQFDSIEVLEQSTSVEMFNQSNSVEVSKGSENRITKEKPAAKILPWSESPKRKGKRQTDRLSFVLTSQRWQNMVQQKEADKKAEEEAKEERKQMRVAKRKAQEDEKEKRKHKQGAKKPREGVKI